MNVWIDQIYWILTRVLFFTLTLSFNMHAKAIWNNGEPLRFSVTVYIDGDPHLEKSLPLGLYEKRLYLGEDGYYAIDSFQSKNQVIPGNSLLPTPTIIGESTMNFSQPRVSPPSLHSPLRIEFLDSIILILGLHPKTQHPQEVNISEFTLEDRQIARRIYNILTSGYVVDEEGQSKRVFGINIRLAYNRLDYDRIIEAYDSLELRPEDIRLEVEKPLDNSLGENVVLLNEVRFRREIAKKAELPTEMITFNDLRARCQVLF